MHSNAQQQQQQQHSLTVAAAPPMAATKHSPGYSVVHDALFDSVFLYFIFQFEYGIFKHFY